jgi:hypothetical protein
MTVRFYIASLTVAAALSGLGLAATSSGHLALGIALPTIGGLLTLSALLWLLKKEQRR